MSGTNTLCKRSAPPAPGKFRKARVLLVDDHPMVRTGLVTTINGEPDLEVCGQAGSASQALQAVTALIPDLVIADLSLDGSHGIDLIKDLRAQHPHIRVLVLSMHDEMLYAERAVRAGARGYLMKKESPETLVDALRRILRGEHYFSPAIIFRMHQELSQGKPLDEPSPVSRLTNRELEILEMLGRGIRTRQIAADLFVSIKTVQAHCEHIKEKLELQDFACLTRFAVHWLDTEQDRQQVNPARPRAHGQCAPAPSTDPIPAGGCPQPPRSPLVSRPADKLADAVLISTGH